MDPNSTTLPKVCPQCGITFTPAKTRPNQLFCSKHCRVRGVSRVTTSPYKRRGENLICKTCGETFYAYPSHIAAGKTYCSNKCKGQRISETQRGKPKSAEHRAKHSAAMRGRPSPRKKPDYILDCKQCGRPFTVPGGTPKRASVARFCSTTCWYNFIRENPEQNTLFRGGRFPYYGSNWAEQARIARRRDKYTCQDCGKKQRRPALDVHHIQSRRVFAGDWQTANALDNLVSLCKSCHTKREHAERSP